MFKLSKYNVEIPNDDVENIYVWNTKKGSIVKLEKPLYDALKKDDFQNKIVKDNLNDLQQQGIILNSNVDETQEIIFNSKSAQFTENGNTLTLVIAPTFACNYKCVYCFEEGIQQTLFMNEVIVDGIKSFTQKYVKDHKNLKTINIYWFGGEPLLAYEKVIKPLSDFFIQLSNENNLMFNSSIITNGSLFNEDIINSMILNYNTEHVQITFDGTCENYCKRKGTTKENYNKVKDNVFALCKVADSNNKKFSVTIRLNVDKENYEDVKDFVNELKNDMRYSNKIGFGLGRLQCGDCKNACTKYYSLEEFSKTTKDFLDFLNRKPKLKTPKLTWCAQQFVQSFCIGPEGELYKCEHEFGHPELVVGDIFNGLYYNEYYTKFMNQPYNLKCIECKYFPICLGGCPHQRFHNGKGYNCEYLEDFLIDGVKKYIKQ